MQVGVTQLVVDRNWSMAEFFKQARATGYEVVEICMRREGELTPTTPEAELRKIASQAREAGVEIVSMCHSHLTGNLLGDDQQRQTAIQETQAGLRAAAAMGVRNTLHTLGRLQKDIYYDQAYQNGVASLKELARTCRETGVDIACEFVWSGFAFSPLEYRNFLDEVGSEHVGFYFDPGNMAVYHFPHHWVKILGRHIKMVHLKDWKGNALNGSWPALLEGAVDYAAMNRELRALGYDGPMISEVPPSDASLQATAESIRKIISM